MQSVKARKALLDDTILDCATLESGIFSYCLLLPLGCCKENVLLDLKLGLKTKQNPTPRIITDKGRIQDCRK